MTNDEDIFTQECHDLSQHLSETLDEALLDFVVPGSIWHVGPNVLTDSNHGNALAEHTDEYGPVEVMSVEVVWHVDRYQAFDLMLQV